MEQSHYTWTVPYRKMVGMILAGDCHGCAVNNWPSAIVVTAFFAALVAIVWLCTRR